MLSWVGVGLLQAGQEDQMKTPSGKPIVAAAASIIVNAHTASAVDVPGNPTRLATIFKKDSLCQAFLGRI